MSEHRVELIWQRDGTDFVYETYGRDHAWFFEGGAEVEASAAPEFRGNAARVDPEQAFVASIASCHMLTFLAIAARKRYNVRSYRDRAVGHLEKNERGQLAITRVELRPQVEFDGTSPDGATLAHMHESAHEHCYIAASVRTTISIGGHGPGE